MQDVFFFYFGSKDVIRFLKCTLIPPLVGSDGGSSIGNIDHHFTIVSIRVLSTLYGLLFLMRCHLLSTELFKIVYLVFA